MAFAIKRWTPPPFGTIFHPFFYPTFFAIEPNLYETDFTLGLNKKYHF